MKNKQKTKNNFILGVLFLLPVVFVFIMTISTENYEPLDIVKSGIKDITSNSDSKVKLEGNLTVLSFLGKHPLNRSVEALNLKEIVYDKFKGFKKFQILTIVTKGAEKEADQLFKKIASYEDLRFWQFVALEEEDILKTFNSLKSDFNLDNDFSTDKVFIIDTDLNQRGRIDAREDKEKEKNKPVYDMNFYSCIEIAELKNKFAAEDLRVLFTEYRQKRKGDFNTDIRRADDLKGVHEEN